MDPADKICSPEPREYRWQEITGSEIREFDPRLREALEIVCVSLAFRTSPKSCEFLRHIVVRSLEGDTGGLKERLIGMALLGRDADYDTSTDAGVRVRANDVRKRLSAYNRTLDTNADVCFGLPAGTYIPVFYRSSEKNQPETATQPEAAIQTEAPPARLSIAHLAAPTLAALFLCVICLRWDFAQAHTFLRFWNQVLPEDRALLYMPPSSDADGQDLIAIRELKLATPLLDVAGQFHRSFNLISTPSRFDTPGEVLVWIGGDAAPAGQPHLLTSIADGSAVRSMSRFIIEDTPAGREILDRQSQAAGGTHGALLTIANGAQRLIWIDGTDDSAIRLLVDRLCNQSTFPATLADSFQPGTMTQAIFPGPSSGDPILVRLPLRRTQDVEPGS